MLCDLSEVLKSLSVAVVALSTCGSKAKSRRSSFASLASVARRFTAGAAWPKQGVDGLAAKVRERSMRLTEEQLGQLVTELKKGATAHGWRNELWTGERVGVLIERLFHVTYSPDHVRKLLRERLLWTSQKPERRGRERDETEIERWRKE